MIHKIDPRQKRLFDPYQGLITPAGLKIIAGGWQGLFRHILLEKMPILRDSIGRRNPYVDPLSLIQLVLLRRIRSGTTDKSGLLEAVLESINGIASGLKNTG